MSPYLDIALAALHDLRDDYHRKANRSFFQSRFATYGDLCQHEATVRNCIRMLETLQGKDPLPAEVFDAGRVAS